MKTKIKFKKLHEDTNIPKQIHPGDAGFDLFAYTANDHFGGVVHIYPGERALIKCGFSMEIENGWEAQIRPRSGLAAKNSITVLNSPGTIDFGFRGEICVILINHGKELFSVMHGNRIAQMIISKIPEVEFEVVDNLSDSTRGSAGFGSSGV